MKTRASPVEPHTGILVPPGWSSHFLLSRVVKSSSKTVLPEIFPPIRIWNKLKKKKDPQIFKLVSRDEKVQSFLFVFIWLTAQNWHCTANTVLRGFQDALVFVVSLPIWQETTENKSKDWQKPSWAKLCLWKLHVLKLGKQNLAHVWLFSM